MINFFIFIFIIFLSKICYGNELLSYKDILSKNEISLYKEMMKDKEYQDGEINFQLSDPNNSKKNLNFSLPSLNYRIIYADKRLKINTYSKSELILDDYNDVGKLISDHYKKQNPNFILLARFFDGIDLLAQGFAYEKGVENKILPPAEFGIIFDDLFYKKSLTRGFGYNIKEILNTDNKLKELKDLNYLTPETFYEYWNNLSYSNLKSKPFIKSKNCIYFFNMFKKTIKSNPVQIPYIKGKCVLKGISLVFERFKYFNAKNKNITPEILKMIVEIENYKNSVIIR